MRTYRPAVRWWSLIDSRLIAHYTETPEVHRDRFVLRTGVFTKCETVIPFSRITNYSAEQTVIDRMYGIWDFTIETAGSLSTESSYQMAIQVGFVMSYPGQSRLPNNPIRNLAFSREPLPASSSKNRNVRG